MKINNVLINNWEPPGEEWWEHAKANPDKALIVATIDMTLSWNEYNNLVGQDEDIKKLCQHD